MGAWMAVCSLKKPYMRKIASLKLFKSYLVLELELEQVLAKVLVLDVDGLALMTMMLNCIHLGLDEPLDVVF